MTLNEALEFAEKCKKEGHISTSAKAIMTLADAYTEVHQRFANLDRWLNAEPGWYVKDYADGWMYFLEEKQAREMSEDMGGAAIREVKNGVCKQL